MSLLVWIKQATRCHLSPPCLREMLLTMMHSMNQKWVLNPGIHEPQRRRKIQRYIILMGYLCMHMICQDRPSQFLLPPPVGHLILGLYVELHLLHTTLRVSSQSSLMLYPAILVHSPLLQIQKGIGVIARDWI